MCELAGTGADPIVLVLAAVLALAGIVGGALLLRRRGRAGAAALAIALLAAAALVAPPAPALAADCPPPAASAPSPTTGAPSLAFGPASVAVAVGEVATATLTNSGDAEASGLQLAPSASVTIDATDCGATLAAGASCTVTVRGAAAGVGSVTASADGAADAVLEVAVAPPAFALLSVAPMSIVFPVDGLDGQQSVTITNAGTIAANNVILAPSPQVEIVTNNCPPVLAPGLSCVVSLAAAVAFADEISISIAGDNTSTVVVTASLATS